MREGESLKAYSDKYWKLFNKINGYFGSIAASTFKVGLPMDSNLRKSLTMTLTRDMHQLMKVFTPERKDSRLDHFGPSRLMRNFFSQAPQHNMHAVNSIFKEHVF